MTEIELALSFPLDTDGFLRRACPICLREFKWLWVDHDDKETEIPQPEEYYCPYCGGSATPNEWFTSSQVAYINTEVFEEVVRPRLDEFTESLDQLNRTSGGLIEFTANVEGPKQRQAPPVFEPNDMMKVVFPCHPEEPVKVNEEWDQPVHCLCCGYLINATPQ